MRIRPIGISPIASGGSAGSGGTISSSNFSASSMISFSSDLSTDNSSFLGLLCVLVVRLPSDSFIVQIANVFQRLQLLCRHRCVLQCEIGMVLQKWFAQKLISNSFAC